MPVITPPAPAASYKAWADISSYVDNTLLRENNVATDAEKLQLFNEAIDELNSVITPRRQIWSAADLSILTDESGIYFEIPGNMAWPAHAVMYDGYPLTYIDPLTYNALYDSGSQVTGAGLALTECYTVEGSTVRMSGTNGGSVAVHGTLYLPYYEGTHVTNPMIYLPMNYGMLPAYWALAHIHASADSNIEQQRVAMYDQMWARRFGLLRRQLSNFNAEAYRL